MEYEYKEAGFKKASEAVIAFEDGTELFIMNDPCLDTDTFTRMNIYGAFTNFGALYTLEEKAIDFEKEFVLDTPWMLKLGVQYEETFAFACAYLPSAYKKFIALDRGKKLKDAPCTIEWAYARHLTPEEEIKYLGAEK